MYTDPLDSLNSEQNEKPPARPNSGVLISDFESGKEISVKLIREFHPELLEAKIVYLCRSRAQKQSGIKVPGKIKKSSPVEKHLSIGYFGVGEESDFIMTVALDVWNEMDGKKRIALIDHLLTRCVVEVDDDSGEAKFSLRHPSVQEFPEITKRHGLWNDSLIELAENLK